jgi:hypothetical protein
MTTTKLITLTWFTLLALWMHSSAWTRGNALVDADILIAAVLGFALGVLYGPSEEREAFSRMPRVVWATLTALFGIALGVAVGIIQWLVHKEWSTFAFLTDCAFGLALGILWGVVPVVKRNTEEHREQGLPRTP